ncbi:protein-nucleus import-related protein [Rhodotorula toruloides NP11]|uniref:Protein-nucleus import-related protein n=1 Tax=Rhodotorula toruloides (strain NP11) TaxID=1130832 RepID=M7WS77_RHOT1|nr:protein-nucleus import-related protein [Rhodotorula toruloides NP11]EMS23422.1 protein-nucleus import-related protein [Rhodotorula toruloides NP11]
MPAPRKSLFSSLASTTEHARLPDALVEWVKVQPAVQSGSAGQGRRAIAGLDDLKDGVALGEVLVDIDAEYFRSLANSASNAKALSENWVLRFNNLKRLYKLIVRYFEDVLHSSTAGLLTPNLQEVAKNADESDDEVCKLAGLVLALTVQSDKKQQHITRIQSLDEWIQRELMYSIEQVMSKVRPADIREEGEDEEVDDFYEIRHEKSRIMHDKEALQVMYEDLLEQFNSLKDQHEETLSNLAMTESKAAELADRLEASKKDRPEQTYKAEFERLRGQLTKTENQLGEAEQVVERQAKVVEDLTRKVDDLAPKAEEALRLKDQMDEYRHASEKAKKQENVIEKYKKKLEEAAETRRMLKTLEDQNADLLDKNASLEEEYQKVSAFKPLMESYKSKIDSLESNSSDLQRETDKLRLELERTREKLRVAEEERQKEGEALVLYEEKVKELEMGDGAGKRRRPGAGGRRESGIDGDDSLALEGGVAAELDDALAGTTTTDLKLRIRRLERELKNAKGDKADSSRLIVLENLLEDANRMKGKYEKDYLREHREKLVLNAQLEEIMSGKSRLGDGPEAALALRQRLNETVDELEKVRREHAELDVKLVSQERELTVAKSDLNLVNKDQLEILHSLRASVSSEKSALEAEVDKLKKIVRDMEEKSRAHAAEVNRLLMEKIELQADTQSRLASLEKENESYKTQVGEMQDKLRKMKEFIKEQDRLFKRAHAAEQQGNFEEAEQGFKQQIRQLEEQVERLKANSAETERIYRREQQLMLSAWHDLSMRTMRERIAASATGGTGAGGQQRPYQPQSWLSQQRARVNGKGLRHT